LERAIQPTHDDSRTVRTPTTAHPPFCSSIYDFFILQYEKGNEIKEILSDFQSGQMQDIPSVTIDDEDDSDGDSAYNLCLANLAGGYENEYTQEDERQPEHGNKYVYG
jgi:hypothetical protein